MADTLRATDRVAEWRAAADDIRARHPHPGLERHREVVHPVLRLRRPRRVEPDDPHRRASCPPTTRACWPPSTPSPTASPTHEASSTATAPPPGGTPTGSRGEEGTFLLCTFWLAQALAVSGQATRARQVFERAARYVNDVGLLAEEVDPATGDLLGNFPQAFSHIGLVNAAWAIAQTG